MAETLPLLDILCADKSGARMALEAAGCVVEPGLQLAIEHPMIGTIHRMFGVVQNLADNGDDATDRLTSGRLGAAQAQYRQIGGMPDAEVLDGGRRLGERMLRLLEDPDNERAALKLLDGQLKYMPANKTLAGLVRKSIGLRGAHIPWSFQALNLGLSMKVQKHCAGYGFVVFYSEDARFDNESPPNVKVGRVFTTPFGVAGFGTWQEPIRQDILDEDVGLILEANWLGAP
ncbi:MAG: hypothetical protein H6736_19510 [Alphaproteobacteria bacterium]|nr:hypothetical protein [Alphaproteobacteria bacterium]MCB9694000.1 hypothetical protein [Alphaproteobacteria bacterium]